MKIKTPMNKLVPGVEVDGGLEIMTTDFVKVACLETNRMFESQFQGAGWTMTSLNTNIFENVT
jgi:hypothetical protein